MRHHHPAGINQRQGLAVLLVLSAAGFVDAAAAEVAPDASVSPIASAAPDAAIDSVALPTPAETTTAKSPATASVKMIEEVIITAQKREESLQEVPISVQAFSADALASRGIEDVTQIAEVVPAMQVTGVAGYNLLYIRGVGTDAFIPSSAPSVATYLDGIYLPSAHGFAQGFGAIERVEVLKGPQGTLFGRNSTGGAINIITSDPDPQVMQANASIEAVNYDSLGIKAYASAPATDWLSLSASAIYDQSREYYRQLNRDLDDAKTRAGRLKASIRPHDDVAIGLTYLKTRQQVLSSIITENNDPSLVGSSLGIPQTKDDYLSEVDYPATLRTTQTVYYGDITWTLPSFDTRLLLGDVYAYTPQVQLDFDGSSLPLAAFGSPNQYQDYQTAELQFLSNDHSWAADRFRWVAGLYYLRSEVGYKPAQLYAGSDFLDSVLTKYAGLPNPPALVGLLDRLAVDNTPLGPDGLTLDFNGLLGTRSYSGFVHGTWSFSDQLDLTLGARYQREKRFLVAADTNVRTPNDGDVRVFSFALEGSRVNNVSPKAVLSYKPSDAAMTYVSWSRGFKSATYNIVNIYNPPDYVKPEEVTQYELGLKSDWLGGRLRINTAIFETTIRNLQSGFVSLLAGGAVTLENAGEARIRGAEFEATTIPFAIWNPGLVIGFNAAYLHGRYTDYDDGSGFQEGTGVFSGSLDFTGNAIARTPKWTGNLSVAQTLAVGEASELEVSVDTYYNSGFFFDANNVVEEGRYVLLGAGVSYLYRPWNLRVIAQGRNLLDERYHYSRFPTDFGVSNTLAAPRTYSLRLAWSY